MRQYDLWAKLDRMFTHGPLDALAFLGTKDMYADDNWIFIVASFGPKGAGRI